MGLFDKMKNLFTEEVEEEPRKVEQRRVVDVPPVKPTIEKIEKPIAPVQTIEPKREEVKQREDKFVYFTDDDFKDLEKPKKVEEIKKPVKKEEKPLIYKGTINNQIEKKKEFKPSPIISPVYGVLDKDYDKDDIKPRKINSSFRSGKISVDDVRNKAYGTVEDDIKDDLLGKVLVEETKEEIEPDINIFDELDKLEDNEDKEEKVVSRSTSNVDEIFGRLDTKKEQILGELDEKKEAILDEIDNKTNSIDLLSSDIDISIPEEIEESDISNTDIDVAKGLLDDEEAMELAHELEEQKKKLDEINNMMNENEEITKTKSKKKEKALESDDLEESELFDLIDSTYEKKDDE